MSTSLDGLPVVLIAGARDPSLASVLDDHPFTVAYAQTGSLALEWARDLHPDTIILDAALPDMSGIEACRLLRSDLGIGPNVPILILCNDEPSPERYVSALHAGAWDLLRSPRDAEHFALQVQAYVQAKRNVDVAFTTDLIDRATGLHSRLGLVRRARELGALMTRTHGSLACVVFCLDTASANSRTASLLVQATRASDVVGALEPAVFTLLAPATDRIGAAKLARRVGSTLRDATSGQGPIPSTLRVGYEAVANLKYAPMDPVELLTRARAAVRHGSADHACPWLRRFDGTMGPAPEPGATPRRSPVGLVLDERSGDL